MQTLRLRTGWLPLLGSLLAVIPSTPAPGETLVSTAFTYQGLLKKSGSAVTATCAMRFTLWDAASNGNQKGPFYDALSVVVTDGLFTVPAIDFGDVFNGNARWLEIGVQCPPDPGYTTLSRVAVHGTPYALGLRAGAEITAYDSNPLFSATNTLSGAGASSLFGRTGVGSGVLAGAAVWGDADSGTGVSGTTAGTGYGVYGWNVAGSGIYGGGTTEGIHGNASAGTGIVGVGTADGTTGYTSRTTGAYAGVRGQAHNASGQTQALPAGVLGETDLVAYGVAGYTSAGTGVYGDNGNSNTTGHAGYFNGRVTITGNLTVNGTFSNPSDALLKTDVAPLGYGLDELRRVRPVTWLWADRPADGRRAGVIAQELEPVLPELVVHDCDADQPLGVDTLGLVPVLVHALQEEDELVRSLARRIAELEARLPR